MLPVSIYALGNSGEYTSGCILDCASEVKLFVAVNKTIIHKTNVFLNILLKY